LCLLSQTGPSRGLRPARHRMFAGHTVVCRFGQLLTDVFILGCRPSLRQTAARQEEHELAHLQPAGRLRAHAQRPHTRTAEALAVPRRSASCCPACRTAWAPAPRTCCSPASAWRRWAPSTPSCRCAGRALGSRCTASSACWVMMTCDACASCLLLAALDSSHAASAHILVSVA